MTLNYKIDRWIAVSFVFTGIILASTFISSRNYLPLDGPRLFHEGNTHADGHSVNELAPSDRAVPPYSETNVTWNAPDTTTAIAQTRGVGGDFIDLGAPGVWPERPSNQTLLKAASPARLVDLSNPDSWPERPLTQQLHLTSATGFVDLSDPDAWPDRPSRKSQAASDSAEVVPMGVESGERPVVPVEMRKEDDFVDRYVPMGVSDPRL